MSKLVDLPYIDKAGGLIQVIEKVIPAQAGEDKPIIKRLPISAIHAILTNQCDTVAKNPELLYYIPETKLKGMFYFEDGGVTRNSAKRSTSLDFWSSKLRLVVWMNQAKIQATYDYNFTSNVIREMISRFPSKPINYNETLKQFYVDVSNIQPMSSSVFSAYDYNEKETQFLMPPYDFFAIDLNINYGIPRGCAVPIIPEPNIPNC